MLEALELARRRHRPRVEPGLVLLLAAGDVLRLALGSSQTSGGVLHRLRELDVELEGRDRLVVAA